ncbi:MAG: hypothetical protein ACYC27_00360 [Armatimonadota bacterium]
MKSLFILIFSLAAIPMLTISANCKTDIILAGGYQDSSDAFRSDLMKVLADKGFPLRSVAPESLSTELQKENTYKSILVLSDASRFPANAKSSLESYLKRGNHLLAISGPAFGRISVLSDGKWLDKDEIKADLVNQSGIQILDFASSDISKWQIETDTGGVISSEYKVEPSGSPQVPNALHTRIRHLSKWDMIINNDIHNPFPEGYTGTAFWVKGGPNTPELAIEWKERDGTRWISVVKLTTEWKRYALLPEDFKFWDGPVAARRETSFDPKNVERLSFLLSDGITKQKLNAPHEYWVSDVRAVKDEYANLDFTPPILESISPVYKTYRTQAHKISPASGSQAFDAVTEVVCSIPRPMGFGSDSVRTWREIPILNAVDKSSVVRGTAAHLFINTASDYAGSIWGYIGFDQKWLGENSKVIIPHIISMLQRMEQGVFLSNAGTEHFAYAPDENIKSGAYLSNYGSNTADVEVEFSIFSGVKKVFSSQKESTIPAGTVKSPLSVSGENITLPSGEYTVKTTLSINGKKIDEIKYPFNIIAYPKLTAVNTVSAKNGDFYLNGKKWYPFGMNYFPRYTPAQETFSYWIRWLSPEQYNPIIAEQDLALAQKLGMNTFSISYIKPDEGRALMDFAARAERHGIKLNVYVPGLHPIWQDFPTADSMIKAAHLHENPALFAYDLGIEVHLGYYADRKPFDYRWQQWVIDRYGSIENAGKDWNYKPQVVDNFITGPSDDQLMNDGAWRIYVAAYRRFWDDEISKGYRKVREHVKQLDQYHLMGAKSGWAGTGSMWAVAGFPFDLCSGVKHLDFTSPEAYNINGDRKEFLKGGFTTAYSRFVGGGKPVFWAEFGPAVGFAIPAMKYSGYTPQMLEDQRKYYNDMFNMLYDVSTNGGVGWWWPAGYRIDEKSDLGIVGADLIPRPSALEFPKMADKFGTPREIKKPDYFLTIDRDKYVTGYAGIYTDFAHEYVKEYESGKFPGIKTSGTGTTSANTPLVAVGNVPYNGHNPSKYLNAEFNYIKINGKIVNNGDTVQVEKNKPIRIEASIGNTAEAMWLAPKINAAGGVYLAVGYEDNESLIPVGVNTPYLNDTTASGNIRLDNSSDKIECKFYMFAKDRMKFGEVVKITFIQK